MRLTSPQGTKPAEGKKRLNELGRGAPEVTEHLKRARYFHAQAEWLQAGSRRLSCVTWKGW